MSNIIISALIVSRGRPRLLYDNWKNTLSLALHPENVELLLYVDNDDLETIEMSKIMEKDFVNVKTIIGERLCPFSKSWNSLCEYTSGEIYFYVSDDAEIKTKYWDEMVLKEFSKINDKILLVYGDDGYQGGKTAGIGFVHKIWVDVVGHLFPNNNMAASSDSWITSVARELDRLIYLDNLKIKHLKYETRKDIVKDKYYKINKKLRKRIYRKFKKRNISDLVSEDVAKLRKFLKKEAKNNGYKTT